MDLLISTFAAVLVIASGVVVHLIASDLAAHAPSIAQRLIQRAVARLPAEWRARYEEEWKAHLVECRGWLSKLWHSLNCLIAAGTVARICDRHPVLGDYGFAVEFEVEGVGLISMKSDSGVHVVNVLKAALAAEPSHLNQQERQRYESAIAEAAQPLADNLDLSESQKLISLMLMMQTAISASESRAGSIKVRKVDPLGRAEDIDLD